MNWIRRNGLCLKLNCTPKLDEKLLGWNLSAAQGAAEAADAFGAEDGEGGVLEGFGRAKENDP